MGRVAAGRSISASAGEPLRSRWELCPSWRWGLRAGCHRIREALVQTGIPKERIAILNGLTAKDTAKRQNIAERFNGTPEEGIEPEFDVLFRLLVDEHW